MLKPLLTTFSIIVLLSCGNQKDSHSKTASSYETDTIFTVNNPNSELANFIKSFWNSHPNVFDNRVVTEKYQEEFKNEFEQKIKSGILNDLTFRVLTVMHDDYEKKNKVSFTGDVSDKYPFYDGTVFVDTEVSDSLVMKLKEDGLYKINGTFTFAKYSHVIFDQFLHCLINGDKRILDGFKVSIQNLDLDLKNVTPVAKI